MNRKTVTYAAIAAALFFGGLFAAQSYSGGGETTLSALARKTHVHGIAVDPQDPSRLLLATHHGFHIVSSDAKVTQVSEITADFMGFTPHPTDPSTLFASGHPASGGNLGVIVSNDGGKTWQQLSEGAQGPVDFHQMDVSKADPNVIYGAYGGLQVSRDAGKTWTIVGPQPDRLIDLAASAKDPDTVYAATEGGLLISMDGGKSWQATKISGRPVALVEVAGDGRIFAFAVGEGLMQGTEGSPKWEPLSSDFGDHILLHLAADPTNADKLYAVTHEGQVLASQDGGRTWQPFGAS